MARLVDKNVVLVIFAPNLETTNVNSKIPFNTLGLSAEILKTIEKKGFEYASEIQAKSIPVILDTEHDIVGIAQTGTGKTAAFGLPLMDKLTTHDKYVKCIILTPTRELAIQVANELDSFKGDKRIKTLPVYGGADISMQIKNIKRGVDIVVGTPGRVQDMINRRVLDLATLEYFVLDEADEMLKMGFIDDIEAIMESTPSEKRVFLYSATMPPRIQNLSKKYMKKQVVLEVKSQQVNRDNIEQIFYRVRRSDKYEVIKAIIELADDFHGIIFCQTKVIVNELSDLLKKENLDVDCIHGDVNQAGRERILKKFKEKKINILIATDVAARGIDVNDLTHVINHTIPKEIDSYVHRIGRTGRAGKKGIAITFIDNREEYKIKQIIRETKNNIVEGELPSREAVAIKRQEKLISALESIISTKDTSFYANVSKRLAQAFGDTEVISALLYQINGSGKPEPRSEEKRYDHDEYRRERRSGGDRRRSGGSSSGGGYKGSRTSSGGGSRARTLGKPERKSHGGRDEEFGNRATRRFGKKRTDGSYEGKKSSDDRPFKKERPAGHGEGFSVKKKSKAGGKKKRSAN